MYGFQLSWFKSSWIHTQRHNRANDRLADWTKLGSDPANVKRTRHKATNRAYYLCQKVLWSRRFVTLIAISWKHVQLLCQMSLLTFERWTPNFKIETQTAENSAKCLTSVCFSVGKYCDDQRQFIEADQLKRNTGPSNSSHILSASYLMIVLQNIYKNISLKTSSECSVGSFD